MSDREVLGNLALIIAVIVVAAIVSFISFKLSNRPQIIDVHIQQPVAIRLAP